MSLAQNPPPLFKQGSSATLRLVVAAVTSLILINLDANFNWLEKIRNVVFSILNPAVELMQLPRDGMIVISDHITTISALNKKLSELEQRQAFNSESLLVLEQLRNENFDLRKLLDLKSNFYASSVAAEIRYELTDPYSKKIVINRGKENKIEIGHPVISADGVVGQVSRVFENKSEITLITDGNISVPVVLPRTKIKAITKGQGTLDGFELNYTDLSAKLMIGDKIFTSGLDGLYPPGIIVGKIVSVYEASPGQFPKIIAKPSSVVGLKHQVLIMNVETNQND
ncbi:MAG: rod shape-determining protein MreC [Betaproteobacteria bacterium TMED156]|nr:MAG: rod shape-determining protein MreC [Betaproteobacteria bacterium TMED156]